MWVVDASVAFVLVLVMVQLSLLWLDAYVDSAKAFSSLRERQLELISASDRLIGDPACLAKEDGPRTLPQTIDLGKKPGKSCHGNFSINSGREGLVVRRLVFLGGEGGEVGVLEVW